MKYLIASDIHGSSKYCELLINKYNEEKPEKLILLGDILYHGPRNDLPEEYAPKKVFQMLNEIKDNIICVRGNCDAEVDQMVLEFPIMADYAILPHPKCTIYLSHGHIYNQDTPLPMAKGDILICGHTHVPTCLEKETFTYLNPGSTSLPKDDTPHSYMILEDNTFYWKDICSGNIFNEFTIK